jgi:hypothetical protein
VVEIDSGVRARNVDSLGAQLADPVGLGKLPAALRCSAAWRRHLIGVDDAVAPRRAWRWAVLVVVALVASIGAGCDSSAPGPHAFRGALLSLIDSGDASRVLLEQFTPGEVRHDQHEMGTIYQMDFSARVRAVEDGWIAGPAIVDDKIRSRSVKPVAAESLLWRPVRSSDPINLRGVVALFRSGEVWEIEPQRTDFEMMLINAPGGELD